MAFYPILSKIDVSRQVELLSSYIVADDTGAATQKIGLIVQCEENMYGCTWYQEDRSCPLCLKALQRLKMTELKHRSEPPPNTLEIDMDERFAIKMLSLHPL